MVTRSLPQEWLDELDQCEKAYLSREGPLQQSGWTGTYESWRERRSPILSAVDCDGDFLDVGCANGYLLQCLVDWAKGDKGVTLVPHGMDFGPGLVSLAQARLPPFRDNFHVGNMCDWIPPRKYDYVCASLTLPDGFQDAMFDRFVSEFVEAGGRLILRRYYNRNEDRKTSFNIGDFLQSRGYEPSGVVLDKDAPIYAWIDI